MYDCPHCHERTQGYLEYLPGALYVIRCHVCDKILSENDKVRLDPREQED